VGKMKIVARYIFLLFLSLLLLNGCSSSNNNMRVGEDSTNKDIFEYKNSYIGDNSAVGNILHRLQSDDQLEQFSLETKEKPYGMVVQYKGTVPSMSEEAKRETIIYNSTFIFALVSNVERIKIAFDNQIYLITREKLQDWYGKPLGQFSNEMDLRKLTQAYLQDKSKLNSFFL
jgi:hypothetical protein